MTEKVEGIQSIDLADLSIKLGVVSSSPGGRGGFFGSDSIFVSGSQPRAQGTAVL
jgi:hypothetical protein